MITPGQRLPGAWVPSAADLKVRTPKTEIPSQSYQAVALETRDSDRLLHPRRERPRDSRATKRRDELASPHGRTPRPRITNYSRSRCASQQKRPAHVRFGSLATKQTLPDDRNPLKADIVSRHPRADRMVVILGNRGVRPCQTLTILLHQSAARLGTRARRSGLDLRCDLSTFGQFGPDCRSRGEYATWPCSILPSIASFGAAILWRSRSRISLRTVMRSTVQQCGRKRLVARSNSN